MAVAMAMVSRTSSTPWRAGCVPIIVFVKEIIINDVPETATSTSTSHSPSSSTSSTVAANDPAPSRLASPSSIVESSLILHYSHPAQCLLLTVLISLCSTRRSFHVAFVVTIFALDLI